MTDVSLKTTTRNKRLVAALIAGTVASLAWGALAFGAVYPWAFTPLLVACLSLGLASFLVHSCGASRTRSLAAAFLAIAAACAIQLVPLSSSTLGWISPATDRLLRQYDIAYAYGLNAAGGHPLSIDPLSTWRGLAFLACFGVLLLGLGRILTEPEVGRLAACVTALGGTLALVAIVQRATSAGEIYGVWKPLMPGTPFGPFVNRNHFAGWMLMGLPLAIGLFLALVARGMRGVSGGWRSRILWFSSRDASQVILVAFAVVTMGLSLILTLSRSGISCFLAALVLVSSVVVRKQTVRSRRAVAGGYLLLVATVTMLWAGLDEVVGRFADPGARDLSGRLAIWIDTIRIVHDFPLAGTGLNTYGVATLFYQTAIPQTHLREAHNDYLQLAAEGGLLLGVPIVVAIAIFVRDVSRRFYDASDEATVYWIRTGALTGLVAIALQSIGEFSLQMPGNAVLFTVLCAIAVHAPPVEPVASGRQRVARRREAAPREDRTGAQ